MPARAAPTRTAPLDSLMHTLIGAVEQAATGHETAGYERLTTALHTAQAEDTRGGAGSEGWLPCYHAALDAYAARYGFPSEAGSKPAPPAPARSLHRHLPPDLQALQRAVGDRGRVALAIPIRDLAYWRLTDGGAPDLLDLVQQLGFPDARRDGQDPAIWLRLADVLEVTTFHGTVGKLYIWGYTAPTRPAIRAQFTLTGAARWFAGRRGWIERRPGAWAMESTLSPLEGASMADWEPILMSDPAVAGWGDDRSSAPGGKEEPHGLAIIDPM